MLNQAWAKRSSHNIAQDLEFIYVGYLLHCKIYTVIKMRIIDCWCLLFDFMSCWWGLTVFWVIFKWEVFMKSFIGSVKVMSFTLYPCLINFVDSTYTQHIETTAYIKGKEKAEEEMDEINLWRLFEWRLAILNEFYINVLISLHYTNSSSCILFLSLLITVQRSVK